MMQYLHVDIILPSITEFFDSHFSFSDKVNGRIDSSNWSFPQHHSVTITVYFILVLEKQGTYVIHIIHK